jgi:signal peptidase II
VRRSLPRLAALAVVVVALDRWTKHWASTTLPFGQPIQVVGDYLRFTHTRNSGVAFGIGQGTGFPYYIFSLVAIVAIVWMFLRGRAGNDLVRGTALTLILSGAVGNLVDRVTSGEVVDFIEVGIPQWHWPIFNVADSAVTVGVLLFALTWSRGGELVGTPDAKGAQAAGAAGGDEPARPEGPGRERGGAAGPLPGGGAEGPLP